MAKAGAKFIEFFDAISGARYSFAKGAVVAIGKDQLIDLKEAGVLVKSGIAKFVTVTVSNKK